MTLTGVFVFYTWGGGRRVRVRSISLIIEDIVVSYTSKVEIPISSYLKLILRGSSFLGLRS